MNVPYKYNIRFSYPHVTWEQETEKAVIQLMQSGWVSNSYYVRQLEERIQERFGIKYAIACSNATQGLCIAIRSTGWNNYKVALPAFTWPSTLYALETNNCIPVFGDIHPETWLLDVNSITEEYDAILPVDIFGNQASSIVGRSTIFDAAHGFGLPQLGKRGACEVFSLSHTKIPTGYEGGVILTNDDDIAERAIEYRRLSARMPEFCAVVALKSIDQYQSMHQKRKELIQKYNTELAIEFSTQKILEASSDSLYAIRIHDRSLRAKIIAALERHSIEYKIYYDPLVRNLKETEALYAEILCLPLYPSIDKHISQIIRVINAV